MALFDTNILKIPEKDEEDLLDIVAMQNGFEDYDDMRKKGYIIDNEEKNAMGNERIYDCDGNFDDLDRFSIDEWMEADTEDLLKCLEDATAEEKKKNPIVEVFKFIVGCIYEAINYAIMAWLASYLLLWLYELVTKQTLAPLTYLAWWLLFIVMFAFKTPQFIIGKLSALFQKARGLKNV